MATILSDVRVVRTGVLPVVGLKSAVDVCIFDLVHSLRRE
jgi:hypothetical protein